MITPVPCRAEGCNEPAAVDSTTCTICSAVMCASHTPRDAGDHVCPTPWKFGVQLTDAQQEELDRRHAQTDQLWADIAALEMTPAAESLRPGIPFTIGVPSHSTLGEYILFLGMLNVHFPVTFEDGVKWLGRVHHAPELGRRKDKVRAGEVAAIRTARALAPEFIPDIFIAPGQDAHKLAFFFNERATGQRFELWPAVAAETNYRQIVRGYARFMVQLSAKQFSGVGSLKFGADNNIVVGPLVSKTFDMTEGAQLGVYATSAECKLARLDYILGLIRMRRLGWTNPLSTGAGEKTPVWRYILLLEARALIMACEDMNTSQPTYLRHMDDHVGQLLVDEHGRLDAVIDWEFSAVLPFAEAFTAPSAFSENLPRPGIDLRLVSGNELTPLELQLQEKLRALEREDMARAVGNTRRYQRLEYLMFGTDMTHEFAVGLVRAFEPDRPVPSSKEEWVREGMVKFADDEQLVQLADEWEAFKMNKVAEKAAKEVEETEVTESREAAATTVENATPSSIPPGISSSPSFPTAPDSDAATARLSGGRTPTNGAESSGKDAGTPTEPKPSRLGRLWAIIKWVADLVRRWW